MSENGIDPDISRWVLDFLVREGIEDRILTPLTRILPVSDHDSNLNKLESLVSSSPVVSEEAVAILHQIEGLLQRSGECNEYLKKALCGDIDDVRVYLREERARMGPSFLHSVAEIFESNHTTFQKGKTVLPDADKRNSLSRRKHAAQKHPRGAKITNVNNSGAGPSCNSHLLDSPEVERLLEALESSRLELHAVVKDPLPEALRLAESVVNKDIEPPGIQIRGVDNALDVQFGEENAGCSGQTNAPKSLMERKETAHTFEWNDSIDSSPADLSESSSTSRPHLPTPKGSRASPLNIYKEQKLKKQRQHKWWSIAEEGALRAGVEEYGKGYWKLILNKYHDIFEERTEVDLKDKWRNMSRYN